MTVLFLLTKDAWASYLRNNSDISITYDIKTFLIEGRIPEKLRVDRRSDFCYKTFRFLLREDETEFCSTNRALKAVFIERLNRKIVHLINKPMSRNVDGN